MFILITVKIIKALGEVTVDEMNQHIADGQFAKVVCYLK